MCRIPSETASPLILTPASSQSSSNGYSAIMEFGKKPHKPIDPAFYSTMNQDFRNRPGFNAMDANYRTPEECFSYIQTLTQLAYNSPLSTGRGEYIEGLGLAAYQDLVKGVESPFMAELKRMATEYNATGNTSNPLHSVPQRYLSSQELDDEESESYSNAATAGEGDASEERPDRVGTREMDFRCEQQRERYINGFGLPHDGGSLEDRLLRAINMNHYILVGHMNKEQKVLGDYVSETVTKALDHSHHRLWKKMHIMQQKIDMLSRNSFKESSPLESSFMSPSRERTAPRSPASGIGEGNSVAHLELAILKLWAHIDKIKAEDRLRAEEKAERRELEELIANEILNHHHTMEKMQAKISSMTKEVTCCWTEIRNLQDAVKGLGGRVRVNAMGGDTGTVEAEVHSTLTSATPDSAKLLEKINKELENLARKPGENTGNGWEDEYDECGCDLCGKARAGKSAGVTVGGKSNEQAAARNADESSSFTRKFDERERTLPAGPIPEDSKLAELGQRIAKGVILSDFTSGSPTLQRCIQKWKKHFSIDMMGNQNILELRRPNGDVLVLVTEPSGERKITTTWEIPRVNQPGFSKVTATDTMRNPPPGWFSSHPTSGTQPFAPLPEVARKGIPVTRVHQQPKFGSYGFPWMDGAQGKQPVQDKDVSTQSNNSQGKRQMLQQKLSELKNMINESSSSHSSGLEPSKSKKYGWKPVSVEETEESTTQTLSPLESNGEDKHEAVKEEEMSMDTMLATIDSALTKMSALAKRNEIENERKNAGALTGGSEPTATAATAENNVKNNAKNVL